MTTLITGPSGYIGSRLAQHLDTRGHTVPGIDRQPYDGNALTTGTLVERIYRLLGRRPPSWHIPLSIATPIAQVSDIAADLTGIDFPITAARISNIQPLHQLRRLEDPRGGLRTTGIK